MRSNISSSDSMMSTAVPAMAITTNMTDGIKACSKWNFLKLLPLWELEWVRENFPICFPLDIPTEELEFKAGLGIA